MAETLVQQPKPTQVTPAAAVSTQKAPEAPVAAPKETTAPKESLVKRAASVAQTTPPAAEAPKVTLDTNDVKDPVAKQILEKKLEEANRAIAESFGKVGQEKSKYIAEVETLRKQLEANTNKRYTTADVQALLQRQDFVEAATQLQTQLAPQGVSQETWSSWTPEEKHAFQQQQAKTQQLEQTLMQMQQSQVLSQADIELKQEYPDYDVTKINGFYQKAYANELTPRQIREAVYWATNGKDLVERAYTLGKQDGNSNTQEKLSGLSANGLNITPTTITSVERKPGERSSQAFSSHAHSVLNMLRNLPRKQ